MLRVSLLILLLPLCSYAYEPQFSITDTVVDQNFRNQSAELKKVIDDSAAFSVNDGTNTLTGGNKLYGSTTFYGPVLYVDTVTYTSTTTYQNEIDLAALELSTGPLVNYPNWNTAFGWGNHASGGYLTTESDPVYIADEAFNITASSTTNWNTAYGWGDHASGGYAAQTSLDATNVSTGTIAADVLTKVSKTGDTITGSLIVSANMTANMYYGNGANLTGLVASGGIFELVNGNLTPSLLAIVTDSYFEYSAGDNIQPK